MPKEIIGATEPSLALHRHCTQNPSMSANRPVFRSYLECGGFGVHYKRESEFEIFAILSFGACGRRNRPAVELPLRHCRDHSPRHFDRAKSLQATGLWRYPCEGRSRNDSDPKTATTYVSRSRSQRRGERQPESGPCQERPRGAATHESVASCRCSKTVGPKGHCYWHVKRINHRRPTDESLVGSEKPELSPIVVETSPLHSKSPAV